MKAVYSIVFLAITLFTSTVATPVPSNAGLIQGVGAVVNGIVGVKREIANSSRDVDHKGPHEHKEHHKVDHHNSKGAKPQHSDRDVDHQAPPKHKEHSHDNHHNGKDDHHNGNGAKSQHSNRDVDHKAPHEHKGHSHQGDHHGGKDNHNNGKGAKPQHLDRDLDHKAPYGHKEHSHGDHHGHDSVKGRSDALRPPIRPEHLHPIGLGLNLGLGVKV